MRNQILIRFFEMIAAEEAAVGGEWRGMRGFEDEMFGAVDVGTLRFRIIAPEHKDEVFALGGKCADGGVGELLPTLALMRTGGVGADGKRRVQKQDSLRRPTREIAGAIAHRLPELLFDFFIYILQIILNIPKRRFIPK